MSANAHFIIYCANCGKPTQIYPSIAAKRKCCSRKCRTEYIKAHPFNQHLRNRVNKKCETCGNEFEVIKARENRARFCSKGCRDKSKKSKVGAAHHNWKGGNITYAALHVWISRHKGKATSCQFDPSHDSKRFEWANISGEYRRDLDDWMPLCTECHHKYDNIMEKGWARRRGSGTISKREERSSLIQKSLK